MSRLSDERVDSFVQWERAAYSPSEVQALAREVQDWRRHSCLDSFDIDQLCARHGITVDGIVALVDEVFDGGTMPIGLRGYLRRLARGEGQ